MPSFIQCLGSNSAPQDYMGRTLLRLASARCADSSCHYLWSQIPFSVWPHPTFLLVICAGLVLFQGRFSLLPFLSSISLLYSTFRESPLFLSSGSAILTYTGRRFHSVCSSATNSRTSKPSLRELPFVLWALKPISYASFFRAAFRTAGYHPLG